MAEVGQRNSGGSCTAKMLFNFSKKEKAYIVRLRARLQEMQACLSRADIMNCGVEELFELLTSFCRIAGNLSNAKSFGGCLLAKSYLENRFGSVVLDVAEKAQGANGVDIEATTNDGQRIIGEVKTTELHEIKRNAFGAAQLKEMKKDWAKLTKEKAEHKFFFLTDASAYRIVQKRHKEQLTGIEVILLRKE